MCAADIFRREVSIDQVLAPGAYTVLLSTFTAGEETAWALSLFATTPVTFELLPPIASKR